jgi:prolyl-tRNA editing enzyme YbaK/EbsC (Cys-tRNA(Pro) deacylase)
VIEPLRFLSSNCASLPFTMDALAARWAAIEARLDALTRATPSSGVTLPPTEAAASPTQRRLAAELVARGVSTHAFKRVPADYYDQSLEWRRDALAAPSVAHLCKSLLLANTAHRPPKEGAVLTPAQRAALSPHVLVIVQYAAKLDAEKLRRCLIAAADGAAPAKAFNMRLAPVEVSDRLTGYSHNAVTPIGIATAGIPIVLSHEIAALKPPLFWMGGGEVDLKLAVDTAQFLSAYQPMIADITHSGGGGE